MAEYIERERVIKRLEKAIYWCENNLDLGEYRNGCIAALQDEIGNMKYIPAADVVEVRHGKWSFRSDGAYGRTRCYCSACGKHSGIGGIRENQLKPYCPNCGAKMDGEIKEQK